MCAVRCWRSSTSLWQWEHIFCCWLLGGQHQCHRCQQDQQTSKVGRTTGQKRHLSLRGGQWTNCSASWTTHHIHSTPHFWGSRAPSLSDWFNLAVVKNASGNHSCCSLWSCIIRLYAVSHWFNEEVLEPFSLDFCYCRKHTVKQISTFHSVRRVCQSSLCCRISSGKFSDLMICFQFPEEKFPCPHISLLTKVQKYQTGRHLSFNYVYLHLWFQTDVCAKSPPQSQLLLWIVARNRSVQ